mmetsp:Transcript_15703/g.37075  ORF Transcript_15703/g.37075 Transcript_15703/m.37075 type:complete len:127 (-) Transcript_15703:350-730(-)
MGIEVRACVTGTAWMARWDVEGDRVTAGKAAGSVGLVLFGGDKAMATGLFGDWGRQNGAGGNHGLGSFLISLGDSTEAAGRVGDMPKEDTWEDWATESRRGMLDTKRSVWRVAPTVATSGFCLASG